MQNDGRDQLQMMICTLLFSAFIDEITYLGSCRLSYCICTGVVRAYDPQG